MTAPMGHPRVSVVVPVRDQRDRLRDLFGALEDQAFRDFEVVVVDDGSTDGSDREAERAVVAGRPVRLLRLHQLGAVAARDEGAAAAAAEVLAFTDSNCLPEPGCSLPAWPRSMPALTWRTAERFPRGRCGRWNTASAPATKACSRLAISST